MKTIFRTFNFLQIWCLKHWRFSPKLYPKPRSVTSAIVCQLADPVQDKIHNLFSDGVVPASEIVSSVFFSRNQLFRMEQLPVRTSANFINHLVSRTHWVQKSVVQCKHGKQTRRGDCRPRNRKKNVALWTRTLSQVWTCLKYVPKQPIP